MAMSLNTRQGDAKSTATAFDTTATSRKHEVMRRKCAAMYVSKSWLRSHETKDTWQRTLQRPPSRINLLRIAQYPQLTFNSDSICAWPLIVTEGICRHHSRTSVEASKSCTFQRSSSCPIMLVALCLYARQEPPPPSRSQHVASEAGTGGGSSSVARLLLALQDHTISVILP